MSSLRLSESDPGSRDELFWLNDAQWACVEPLLPVTRTGPKRVSDRTIISGIIHVLQSGCSWRDCPPAYGPYMTVFNRFNRWKSRGVWQVIVGELRRSKLLTGDFPPRDLSTRAQTRTGSAAGATKVAETPASDDAEPQVDVSAAAELNPIRELALAQLEMLMLANEGRPKSDWILAILDWHLHTREVLLAELWLPGMAGSSDETVNAVVSKFHQHELGTALQKLAAENAALMNLLATALKCIKFYGAGGRDSGTQAVKTFVGILDRLGTSYGGRSEEARRRVESSQPVDAAAAPDASSSTENPKSIGFQRVTRNMLVGRPSKGTVK